MIGLDSDNARLRKRGKERKSRNWRKEPGKSSIKSSTE
jgi:hypothetical protein